MADETATITSNASNDRRLQLAILIYRRVPFVPRDDTPAHVLLQETASNSKLGC
jgi:hypothetical protein